MLGSVTENVAIKWRELEKQTSNINGPWSIINRPSTDQRASRQIPATGRQMRKLSPKKHPDLQVQSSDSYLLFPLGLFERRPFEPFLDILPANTPNQRTKRPKDQKTKRPKDQNLPFVQSST
ncbi:predicted protein [Botrytis cinerea T4]|uniref:Uncharacterized protein n=1 Tax=Botryotinia fuckeliana (strain T4) TaxID=999810 RepID=G2YMD1_BOTF4|nr:predicted protein [Botrytis cinerea T4]